MEQDTVQGKSIRAGLDQRCENCQETIMEQHYQG